MPNSITGSDNQLDRLAVLELVHLERASRDEADWETFGGLFTSDAKVEVSWFRGSGEEFVRLSRQQSEAGLNVIHHLTTSRAIVAGDKAIVRCSCIITTISPMRVKNVEVVITADTRLHYRLRRTSEGWRVAGLVAVYLKDAVTSVKLDQAIEFDDERLSSARASYRHLTYLMAERGVSVPQTLAGADRPETVRLVMSDDDAWLGKSAG